MDCLKIAAFFISSAILAGLWFFIAKISYNIYIGITTAIWDTMEEKWGS